MDGKTPAFGLGLGTAGRKYILPSLRYWSRGDWAIQVAAAAVTLPFLWGIKEPLRLASWSFAALGYAGVLLIKGWIPWRTVLWNADYGASKEYRDTDAEQRAVRTINSLSRRLVGFAITASAALTPWFFATLSLTFGFRPIGRGTQTSIPTWFFAIFGLMDAVRSGRIAARWWARDVLKHG